MDLPKKKRHLSVWIILSVIIAVLGILVALFGQRIFDIISGSGYEPSPEMAKIIDNLELTDDAMIVLRAAHPVLQDAEEFNQHCPNNDEEMSTLGCFSPAEGRIYIFNITSSELDGIKESVLSHELLHAIYQRLNGLERSSLNSDLQDYYDSHQNLFGDYLSKYSESMFYTELHSIVGQRFSPSELPQSLRDHYAKYFTNQDEIASYYKKYRTIFDELTENINRLNDEVETWRAAIQKKRDTYREHLEKYEELRELHDQRSMSGSYKSYEESYAAYIEVRDTYAKIEEERQALNKEIDALNDKVNELNEYVERSNELNNIVNSRVNTTTEKTSD